MSPNAAKKAAARAQVLSSRCSMSQPPSNSSRAKVGLHLPYGAAEIGTKCPVLDRK